jgi:hypothetical protein
MAYKERTALSMYSHSQTYGNDSTRILDFKQLLGRWIRHVGVAPLFVATEYKDMMARGKHRIVLNNPGLFLLATYVSWGLRQLPEHLACGGGLLLHA